MKRLVMATALVGALSGPVLADSDAGPAAPAIVDAAPTVAPAPASEPATADPLEPDAAGVFAKVIQALRDGKWLALIGGVLVLMVLLARLILGRFVKWFKTKAGGWVLNFSFALLVAVGGSLLEGAALGMGLFLASFTLALNATGGYEGARDFIAWVGKKLG